MKKIFFILICAMCAVTANAQRYMSVTKTDGSVVEFAISKIDSIHFFVKDNTTPEPPVVDPNNPVENGHEYVDLGLPSGTLWAKMNIGAESITDLGDYFAWGETNTKEEYSLDTYKWYTFDIIVETDADGFETITYKKGYTKYCSSSSYGYEGYTDTLKTLELADDAAHVNWGGAWRMPTEAEFQELINNCTWQWATLNGVSGYKVTSNAEGNTNYIFLPAAGYRSGWSLYNDGSIGYYWSSSLCSNDPIYAWGLNFYSGYHSTNGYYRYYGRSVRPVCSSAPFNDYLEGETSCTDFVNSDTYKNIADGETTEEEFTVRGIVKEVKAIDTGTYGNAHFYITDGTSEVYCYNLYAGPDQQKFVSSEQLKVGDIVTVKSALANFGGTRELKGGYIVRTSNTFDPSTVDTSTKTVTVAEVLAMNIASGAQADGTYQITGSIATITEAFGTQYGNATFTITDDSSAEELTIYRAKYLDNQKWTESDPQIQAGDEVTIVGGIKNYYGRIEVVNCYVSEHK